MGTGQSYMVYQLTPKDLDEVIDKKLSNLVLAAFLSRFENVLIGTNELANMHSVNPKTVKNYIKDGLIVPEVKISENDHYQFRLSYALTLDFKKLQKQLRAKNKGWDNE